MGNSPSADCDLLSLFVLPTFTSSGGAAVIAHNRSRPGYRYGFPELMKPITAKYASSCARQLHVNLIFLQVFKLNKKHLTAAGNEFVLASKRTSLSLRIHNQLIINQICHDGIVELLQL